MVVPQSTHVSLEAKQCHDSYVSLLPNWTTLIHGGNAMQRITCGILCIFSVILLSRWTISLTDTNTVEYTAFASTEIHVTAAPWSVSVGRSFGSWTLPMMHEGPRALPFHATHHETLQESFS